MPHIQAALSKLPSVNVIVYRIMSFPRPVAFFLVVLMFVYGWHSPASLLAFAHAISALPDQFWGIVGGLLASIGISKGIRDWSDRKGQS